MKFSKLLICSFLIALLTACNQQQTDSDNTVTDAESTTIVQTSDNEQTGFRVSGVASKGPIQNATVEIFALDNNGDQTGAVLVTTSTDSNGLWDVNFTTEPTEALLVVVSGGSYIDEADPAVIKRTIALAANESLKGVLFPQFSTASVTILTNALLEKSKAETTSSNFQDVLNNNRNTAKQALGFDPFTIVAADPLSPSTSSSIDSIEYAMYLGGVATALNSAAIILGKPVPDYAIMMGLVDDLSDGSLNGRALTTTVQVSIDGQLQNFPDSIDLNLAILRFRNNNFAAYSVTEVQQIVSVNEALLAVPGTNISPTAVDDSATTVSGVSINLGNLLANDTDADGDQLVIVSFTQPSNGSVSASSSGQFSFTPVTGFTGNTVFTYTASDNRGGEDSAQVVITVTEAPVVTPPPTTGTPPTADAGSDQTVDEQTPVTLNGSGTDSSGNALSSFLWSQVSGTDAALTGTTTSTLSFTAPTVTQIDVLVFTLTTTDSNNLIGIDTVSIIVLPVNEAPTANAGNTQTVNELDTVTLSGSGTDADSNDSISYQWNQISGGVNVTLSGDTSAVATFTAPDISTTEAYVFSLTVTDNENAVAFSTVTIVITSANNLPVAIAGPDQMVNEQLSVTLDASASTDSDGTITSYSWTQTGGNPLVTLLNSNTVQASFIGPNIVADTVLTFFVIVTDNDGNSSTDSIDVTMVADAGVINDDPVAVTDNVITPQGISLLSIPVTANDTDLNGDPVILIGITQPSNGSAINNGDGTVTYIPDLAYNGADSFTYSVIDGQGGTDTGNVNITVDADTDGDGLLDTVEIASGLDPNNPDHDGDGFYDGHEVLISGTAAFLNTEMPAGTVISLANTNNLISTDTTWTLAGSPYWVQTDVNVQGGGTLTIESGVVVKFNTGVDLFVNASGNLNVNGNAPIPQNVRFTSIFDDSLNGDTGLVVGTPGVNSWSGIDFQTNSAGSIHHASVRYAADCFYINNSSPLLDGVEVGDCGRYGIYTYATSGSMTSHLHNITTTDFDSNSQSTVNTGIYLRASNSTTNTLDLVNINLDEVGGTSSYGLYIEALSNSNIPGSVDNVTITNVASRALYVRNTGTGTVDPTISNVSIPSPGTGIGLYVQNTSTGTMSPVFDGINSISNISATVAAVQIVGSTPDFLDTGSWSINTAGYGMYLSNAGGNYNNITMDNTVIAGIRLANASAPSVFSDVVLTNAVSPYELNGQNISATILAGFDFSDVSVAKDYIRVGGSLLNDMSLTADPIGTGNSQYYVHSTITIPAGITLTIDDGAILKFPLNNYLQVNGNLVIGDGDGLGANAILTSFRDDSVGTAIGDGTPVARVSNAHYIAVGEGSNLTIDNAEIRYARYGLYQYFTNPIDISISNSIFSDIYYHGFEMHNNTGDSGILNLDNVSLDTVGVNTSYHGIYLNIDINATFTGVWNDVSINNTGGDGILIDDDSTGVVDPTMSGLNIGNTGTIGQYGIDIQGDATTSPTFDASSGSGNFISGGSYNLLIRGVAGDYSNLTLDGASISPLYFSASPTPTSWDDNSILLTNTSTPYLLVTGLPAIVGTLGTADLGYNQASSTVNEDFVRIGGSIANTTLAADPLGANSQYYVHSTLTIPVGITLTIEDGAILKFPLNNYLQVNGNLVIGDGDGLGANAILTSFRDDSVGTAIGDGTPVSRVSNAHYIAVGEGSNLTIDNAEIRYARYGLYQYFTNPIDISISNSIFSDIYYHGFEMHNNTGDSGVLNLDNVSLDTVGINTSYHGIYLDIDNDAAFTGVWNDVSINNTGGDGILIDDDSTGVVDPTMSGLNIGNTGTIGQYGIDIQGDATTSLTFDASSGSGNFISGGSYNLLIRGVAGDYSNLTLDGASISPLYFSVSPTPTSWDDNSILLTNTSTPYFLVTGLPTIVGTLGTADLGYNQTSSTVDEDFVRIGGSIANTTLAADPLGANSQYYVHSTLTIPVGITLTIEDGAILKFPLNNYLQVNGNLVIGDGDGLGANAILTSFRDDSVGTAIGDGTPVARVNNAHYIGVGEGSNLNIDNAEIRYARYGLYQYYTSPIDISISNSMFSDIYYHGFEINGNTGDSGILNLDNVSLDTVGVNTSYHGIYLYINNNATFTGVWNDVSINNTGGDGILIDDNSTGVVDPTISGLNIGNTGTIGLYGVDIQGDTTTSPTFDASSGSGNFISGGNYNLLIRGVGGDYNNLTLDGASNAAVYFSADTSPNTWSTVTIDNAPTPFYLYGMSLPAVVNYTAGAGLLENYISFSGTFNSDFTLSPDPLIAGTVWYMAADTTVVSGVTMTIDAGTVIKATDGADLFIDGTLNVNGGVGTEVVFTDIRDDSYNGDSNNDGSATTPGGNSNWQGIDFRLGSQGTINNLTVDHAEISVMVLNAGDGGVLNFTNLFIDNATDGLLIDQTSATVPTSPNFTNLTITNASSQHLYLDADNTTEGALMQPTFTGNSLISGNGTDGIYCYNAGPNISLSGFTIEGSTDAVDLSTGCTITLQNSLIRNALNDGVNIRSTAAPTIRNNVIVNNGNGGGNDAGIYVNSSATAYINNNLVRGNYAAYGAGIMIRDSSPVVQNNLIIENHTTDISTYGGGGIFVWNNSSPTIINNTIANNTSVNATGEGAGLHIAPLASHTVTLEHNIIYGNRGGYPASPVANDIYFAGTSTLTEDYNVIGIDNIVTNGVNDQEGSDPLFIDGWYLTVDAVNGGGSDSPAIDAGAIDASSTALGAGTEILSSTTTRTDGMNEQDVNILLDIGYHYSSSLAAPVISASNSTVSPSSHTETGNTGGTEIVITVTPRDLSNLVIGAGLKVFVTSGDYNNINGISSNTETITDLGDGTYQVTYTIPTGSLSDTVQFTVYGVAIADTFDITWNISI